MPQNRAEMQGFGQTETGGRSPEYNRPADSAWPADLLDPNKTIDVAKRILGKIGETLRGVN